MMMIIMYCQLARATRRPSGPVAAGPGPDGPQRHQAPAV